MNYTRMNLRAWFALGLVVLAVVPSIVRAEDPPAYHPPAYVLTVGIGDYAYINDIPAAANDPRLMLDVWQDSRNNADPLINEEATADSIRQAFSRVSEQVPEGGFGVIFIASHGMRQNGEWHLIPHDFHPEEGQNSTAVTGSLIASELDHLLERGNRILLVVDACNAGELRSDLEWVLGRDYQAGGELILLAATQPSQLSVEDGYNGLFTATLAEALRGQADVDADGLVTLKETRRYLSWRLSELVGLLAALPGVPQHEQDFLCDTTINVSDQTPLSQARESRRDHITVEQIHEGKSQRLDDDGLLADGLAQSRIPEECIGQWRYERDFTEQAFEFREIIVFALDQNGRYEISYLTYQVVPAENGIGRQLVLHDAQTGSGQCRYNGFGAISGGGPVLTLDVGSGISSLELAKANGREMTVKAKGMEAFGERWQQGEWTFRRE